MKTLEKKTTTPDKFGDEMNGWMLPDGRISKCPFYFHEETAKKLGFQGGYALEKIGAIKLQLGEFLTRYLPEPHKVTQAQFTAMHRWHDLKGFSHEEKMERMINVSVD